ncbi:hypothetical protein M8494_06775 [Serratia ureilytica]
MIQEGTGADAKYFKATVDASGKVTKGAEQSHRAKNCRPAGNLDKSAVSG